MSEHSESEQKKPSGISFASPGSYHASQSLSPVVNALIQIFEEESHRYTDGSKYQVSRTVSLLAALYEKARNAVEFRAEHLIRRAAIERILKRRILLGGTTSTMGENIIVELLWARYIDSSQIDDAKVEHVQKIIDKYLVVKFGLFRGKNKVHGVSWDTLLGLLSSEIEEAIAPAKKREALNNFYYQAIESKITIPHIDEKTRNILIYIAIERGYAQSDDPLITFHLIKLLQPQWLLADAHTVSQQTQELFENILFIEKALKNQLSDPLYRYIRKQNPPFLLIRDFLLEQGKNARGIIENEKDLENTLTALATKRYHETGTKVRRAVVRSIIYIFLTKTIFALALEAPVDMLIIKRIDYLALGINIIFPPFLLFLIAGFIHVPGADNTAKLVGRIKNIFYTFDELKNEPEGFAFQQVLKKPPMKPVFTVLYVVAFLLSFGFISYVLTKLHFNIASQFIFIFFVTLVSFFAYRIRLSAKEYQIVDRPGILSPVVDFFFIPILSVGRALSGEIAKLNVLLFVFDFILEAPLKVIFEFMEEWFRFIRSKKDEII
jgi:hypothetical protein